MSTPTRRHTPPNGLRPKTPVARGKIAITVRCRECKAPLFSGVEAASFAVGQIFAAWRAHLPACKRIEVVR